MPTVNTPRREFLLGSLAAAATAHAQVPNRTPDIFHAAADGDVPRATELLAADPEIVRLRSADGRTPLHFATANGKQDMVVFLLSHGAELSAGPESPLISAVDYPDHAAAAAMAQTILFNASNPNARNRDGQTALQLAAARGYADIAEILIHRGALVTPRETAAATGEAARLLRDSSQIERAYYGRRYIQDVHGKPVTRDDSNGLPWTLINEFVRVGHFDFEKIQQLHKQTPALLNTRASWDELAVEAAAHVGQVPIAQWLAERGAPISTCTGVLLGLADQVKEAVARDRLCLHERGAHDIALLSYTAWGNAQTAIAEHLLKAGADVHAKSFGQTTLHIAAMKGHVDLAALLLENGADINAAFASKGVAMTPLALAIKAKQSKMEQFLKSRGAAS